MARILLIHGAWGNAKTWALVAPLLAARGHQVEAIDLPSHGDDATPQADVGQPEYVAHVEKRLLDGPPALLVGHSMGGIVVAQVSARQPDHVIRGVYVAALLPRDGESLVDLIRQQEDPGVAPAVRRDGPQGSTVLDPAVAGPILFQDADAATQARALAEFSPQPNRGQTDKAQIGPDFDRVPRAYVFCEQDRTVLPALQRMMVAATPCAQTYSIDCGHMPQVTRASDLAAILDETTS